jgi:succinate dehydrogenase / fumarate reductase, cytochrome b subunit
MLVSILHRATGVGLATGGAAILLWWLLALAGGPEAYWAFLSIAKGWFGQAVLIALTWGVFQHMLSGVRHLYMDTGAGFEPGLSRRLATLTFVGSTLLTAIVWAAILVRGGVA